MNVRPLLAAALALLPLASACGDPPSEAAGDQRAADTSKTPTAAECAALPSGPFTPERVGQPFNGSEDFTFDGQGHVVGKKGSALVRVGLTAEGAFSGETNLASLPGQTYGVRYHPNGSLIAAIPGAGKIVSIAPGGQVTDLLTGLRSPNGIWIDFDANIWFTEFGGNKVSKLAADGTVTALVSGSAMAQGADGIAYDPAHKRLYYTEYQKARINRLDLDAATPTPTPVTVATIPGTALDGMAMDACGNVYAVDNGNSRLYRVRVDDQGAATAAPELLAELPTNIAAAVFGAGPGFDPQKIYMTGNPGTVYAIPVGVGSAPIPMPPAR
jgi:sugar lactone lactonase YvrE